MAEASLGWILFNLALVLFLVFLNGFFVAAEFAIVKIRSTQVEEAAQGGDRRAVRARHVITHLDSYLSATQLGITLASLGLGWVGEPAIAHLVVEPALHSMGVASETLISTLSFAIAFGVITILHIVLGELAPKSLAIQKPMGTTFAVVRPLHWFYLMFRPAIWVLNGLANRLPRLVGIRPASESELVHSEEELRLILAATGKGGEAREKARTDILLNIMELQELAVRDIMTPRGRLIALDLKKSLSANHAIAKEHGFSRFPVVDGNLDNVVGMVLFRDLITLAPPASPKGPAALKGIVREVHFVPESQPAEDLLRDFLRRGRHMAVVVDEFGSTAGIVTLEDVFEELFGEIRDEYDETEILYREVGEGRYLFNGDIPLRDAEQVLDVELPAEGVTTLGGFLIAHLGRFPARGEQVDFETLRFIVRETDRRRVKRIEVQALAPAEERGGGEGADVVSD